MASNRYRKVEETYEKNPAEFPGKSLNRLFIDPCVYIHIHICIDISIAAVYILCFCTCRFYCFLFELFTIVFFTSRSNGSHCYYDWFSGGGLKTGIQSMVKNVGPNTIVTPCHV